MKQRTMEQETMDNRIWNNGTRNKNIDIVSAYRTMRDKERDHEKKNNEKEDKIMVCDKTIGSHLVCFESKSHKQGGKGFPLYQIA